MGCYKMVLAAGLLLLLDAPALPADSPNSAVTLDIQAQPLGDALNEFGRQAGLQVVLFSAVGEGITSPRLVGSFSTKAALDQLLANTSLSYEFINTRTIAIRSAKEVEAGGGKSSAAAQAVSATGLQLARANARLATSAADRAAEETQGSQAPRHNPQGTKVEEIVVTAQKREERLQDVPIPVTAINADTLVNSSQVRLADYYSRIPGLNYISATTPPTVSIRGLTTTGLNGFQNKPTVAIVVDDVPYGGTSSYFGALVPDLDPGDLTRIEVLRGPQGALYGASSFGGLIKYVTVDPSTSGVSGDVQASISSVSHGETGYGLRGAVNIPLGDTFAVRASAFTRRDPGYIDAPAGYSFDPNRRENDINSGTASGGRLSALWRPSESFSLKLGALIQKSESDAANWSADGTLDQLALRGTGGYSIESQVYSATVRAKLGSVDLTSITGFAVSEGLTDLNLSISPFFRDLGITNFGSPAVTEPEGTKTERFSQEIRLEIPLGARFDWLLGGFYSESPTHVFLYFSVRDPLSLNELGRLLRSDGDSGLDEFSLFTNLTWKITDQFDLQFGGRQARMKRWSGSSVFLALPPFGTGDELFFPRQHADDDTAFTYLVTPRFKFSPDLMMYARFASGYRVGGGGFGITQTSLCVVFNFPCEHGPDKTSNYELGLKGNFFNDLLSVDASAYYIDWEDIQLQGTVPPAFGFTFNGSSAKSQGLELSIEARPLYGMTLSGWVAWNDARLTEDLPSVSTIRASRGDRLPGSSRFSGYLSLDQEFPLFSGVNGFAGMSVSYVDDRASALGIASIPEVRRVYPSFASFDVRAGVRKDSWTVNAFLTNVLDKRGVQGAVLYSEDLNLTYSRPRTAGISVSKSF